MSAEFVVDFPTLWVAADWIGQHCVVPDGFHQGEPFELSDWQLWCLVNHYRVKPGAKLVGSDGRPVPAVGAPAFVNRRSQIVLPQKAGKAPHTAAQVCLEGVGPATFAGFAAGGEAYDCADFGCSCGWGYEYQADEPMGRPWPTPLIQITAFSEDQTGNIYDALRPMVEQGPLADIIPKTGEEFIRLPNGGRVDTVTSNARSRLGQRVTFVVQDETGIWTRLNGMVKVAETQRRGLAGMQGRAVETTNAWDPAEESVAQRTSESSVDDVFRFHPLPASGLSYTNKAERRKIHRSVYQGSWWVDLDAIEAEAKELLEKDPTQAERFFGNRVVAGSGAAFDLPRWNELAVQRTVEPGSLITVGVDGARFDDALGMVATEVETGFQWPLGIWEVPANAGDDYEHPMGEVDGRLSEAFETFTVWRVYVDPQRIEALLDRWQGRWGERKVLAWYMNRPRQTAYAVRSYSEAIIRGDLSHDGDEVMARHVGNAAKQKVNVYDEDKRQMWVISKDRPMSPRKIDGAAAGVISWEARGDCIAAGELDSQGSVYDDRGLLVLG